MTDRTNFAQYSHEQLYTMLFASQPDTVSEYLAAVRTKPRLRDLRPDPSKPPV